MKKTLISACIITFVALFGVQATAPKQAEQYAPVWQDSTLIRIKLEQVKQREQDLIITVDSISSRMNLLQMSIIANRARLAKLTEKK